MQIEVAENFVAGLTLEQRDSLEATHWRYMAFAGVILDDQYQEQATADQQAYPHLLKYDAAGRSVVSSERAADFMAAVTGMARDWCLAWDEHDFYETHGVTSEQAAQGALAPAISA